MVISALCVILPAEQVVYGLNHKGVLTESNGQVAKDNKDSANETEKKEPNRVRLSSILFPCSWPVNPSYTCSPGFSEQISPGRIP